MDKETIDLIEEVRKQLIDYGKQTESASVKKKTRKVTSQIIWDAESYLDDLDNIKSTSKTDAEAIERIRSLVRTSEEDALKSMTVLIDDTGHHIVQSRTGGDAFTELPYSRSGPIVSRLSEKHQQKFGNTTGVGGNLPPEMSLSNYAHKADDRATGFERESGIGKNPDKATTAHPRGTAGFANMKGVDMADDAAVEAFLSDAIEQQQQAARTAAQTDLPRQQFLREASGNPELYKGPKPQQLVLDPRDVKQSYLQLGKGSFNFKGVRELAKKAPLAGGILIGGAVLASGGTPGQAFEAAVAAENPIENLDAGPLFSESQDYGDAIQEAQVQNQKPLLQRLKGGAIGGLFPRQIRGRSGAQRQSTL